MKREVDLIGKFRQYIADTNSGLFGVDIKAFEDDVVANMNKKHYRLSKFKLLGYWEKITHKDYKKQYTDMLRERIALIPQDIKFCIEKKYFFERTQGKYVLGRDGDKLLHNWFYRFEVFLREWDRSTSFLLGGGAIGLVWFVVYIWNMVKSLKHL